MSEWLNVKIDIFMLLEYDQYEIKLHEKHEWNQSST